MTSPRQVPIFDGHNDVLLRLYRRGGTDAPRAFLEGEGKGQLDLPMAVQGGFAGGLFAIFVPSPKGAPARAEEGPALDTAAGAPVAPPLAPAAAPPAPPPLALAPAQAAVSSMASILIRIEREANGRVRICRTAE